MLEISDIYVGEATVEAPTPTPPINLKNENSDYEAKRHKDFTLNPPKVILGNSGVFLKWLKKNNKIGGQNKVPRLSNDRIFIEELIKLNN